MNNRQNIFVLIYIFLFSNISSAQSNQTWIIEDIIDIAKAHFSQIQDIELSFDVQLEPMADPQYKENHSVTLSWVPDKNWEKRRTSLIKSSSPEIIYRKTQAWNGEQTKIFSSVIQDTETPEILHKEGFLVSKKKTFSALEPMQMLGLKGSNTGDFISYLSGKDVSIESYEKIDDCETVMVSVNLIPSMTRKESLVVKYWLDMGRGALPLHVELYHKEKLLRVVSEVSVSEIKPGIFFPTACKTRTFGGKSEGRWSQGEVSIFQVKTDSIKVNQGLQKKDFDIKFDYNMPVWEDNIKMGLHEGVGIQNEEMTDMLLLEHIAEDAKQNYNSVPKTIESKQDHKVELATNMHKQKTIDLSSEQTIREVRNNSENKMHKPHKINIVLVVLFVISILIVYFVVQCKFLSKKHIRKQR